jgi:tRNA-2-methylthio-N6-dimethylallyladenosine synthase
MNEADSGRVAAELDALGYAPTDEASNADVIVLNTCVVRQSAEDRAVGRLWSLKPLKDVNPDRVIALMGCMVGIKPSEALKERFPFVDVFMPPSEPGPLVGFLNAHQFEAEARLLEEDVTAFRHMYQDDASPEAAALGLIPDEMPDLAGEGEAEIIQPLSGPVLQSIRHLSLQGQVPVIAHVPVVYGCSHACTFCIIPSRRGAERSRSLEEIVREVRGLVGQGVREVMLLGQIVDRYGKDFPGRRPDLADLLAAIQEIPELLRIRFLTSHPNYMTDRILQAVADLPKVCEQIEVPVQAGADEVLSNMKRGYSSDDYRRLVDHIRQTIPGTAVHTDIIVGFPGETEQQFQRTYDLLAELRVDKAHLAMYSPRPGTVSARKMVDNVSDVEKKWRWDALDALQSQVVGDINRRLLGETVEVLVEGRQKGRWRGRTRTNKLVFFDDGRDWRGRLAEVRITWTGPWSMIGSVIG